MVLHSTIFFAKEPFETIFKWVERSLPIYSISSSLPVLRNSDFIGEENDVLLKSSISECSEISQYGTNPEFCTGSR